MVTITLDDHDRAILSRLYQGNADVASLAESVDCDEGYLRERLPELADNGLVLRVHSDVYRITANGKRTIAASPEGTMDNRIDTPPDVERAIESFTLRPDREEAVRNAFAFLHYWGEATEGEIIDAVYSENPAGFESRQEWWAEGVRDRLADLPFVQSGSSAGEEWVYVQTPIVEQHTDDGRGVADDDVTSKTSVKFALEQSDLNEDERNAVRAAFDLLVQEGDASADEIKKRVYPDHDAGYESASEWWTDRVRDAFESLPGVEQPNADRGSWEYQQSDEGPMSSGPGAEVPEPPEGPADENQR